MTPQHITPSSRFDATADNGAGEDVIDNEPLAEARGVICGIVLSVVLLWPPIVATVYVAIR